MTVILDAPSKSQLAAQSRGVAWLVELMTQPSPIRLTTWSLNVTHAGNPYQAAGALVDISSVQESEDNNNNKLLLKFGLVDTALVSTVLTNVDAYRGKQVSLYLQVFGTNYQPVGTAALRWRGYMDKASINLELGQGGAPGTIEMQCSRAGMPRAKNFDGLRLTDAQQRSRYPGDRGLEYVQKLIEQPTLWLSRRFQEQT